MRRRSRVETLQGEDGTWVSDGESLKSMVTQYYQNLFVDDQCVDEFPVTSMFPLIDEEFVFSLGVDVSSQKVLNIIRNMGAFKAPSPDGFHAVFFIKVNGIQRGMLLSSWFKACFRICNWCIRLMIHISLLSPR